MVTLRDSLVGTWRLVSYEARHQAGDTIFPMGRDLKGYITYTADGHVSVQVMVPGRAGLASGDISRGTTEEWAEAAKGYFAYCGTYDVDETRRTVTHHVELSLVPNWVGQEQVRDVHLQEGRLELSGPPTPILGDTRTAHLVWERVTSREQEGRP